MNIIHEISEALFYLALFVTGAYLLMLIVLKLTLHSTQRALSEAEKRMAQIDAELDGFRAEHPDVVEEVFAEEAIDIEQQNEPPARYTKHVAILMDSAEISAALITHALKSRGCTYNGRVIAIPMILSTGNVSTTQARMDIYFLDEPPRIRT